MAKRSWQNSWMRNVLNGNGTDIKERTAAKKKNKKYATPLNAIAVENVKFVLLCQLISCMRMKKVNVCALQPTVV